MYSFWMSERLNIFPVISNIFKIKVRFPCHFWVNRITFKIQGYC